MELNFLSQAVFELMVLITALLHLILPKSVEPAAASFMIGNLFAVYLFPFAAIYAAFAMAGVAWALPYVTAIYMATILLDPQHLKPPDLKNYSHFRQLNWVHSQSLAFWTSHFDYFPMTVVFDKGAKEAIDPNKQYIFAVHPHGIHCWPLNIFAFVTSAFYEAFPGMQIAGVAATVMFKLPVIRELFLTMHYRDAGRATCEKILRPPPLPPRGEGSGGEDAAAKAASGPRGGSSLFICTGGEAESLQTESGKDKVVLEGREGFVRLALAWGCDLVPVYGLGVTDLYTTYSYAAGLRRWLARACHVAVPLFTGRWGTPLPHKVPVKVLIGRPIPVPKPASPGARPAPELVKKYHAKYVAALTAMYDTHAPMDFTYPSTGVKRALQVTRP